MLIPSKFSGYRPDGVRLYPLDTGNDSPAPAPATQTQVTDIPDWAKPYAQQTLAKGQALTDINANPYPVYGGQRIADFSQMQNQAFQGAQNLQPNQAGQTATNLAGMAGLNALNTNYQAGQFGTPNFIAPGMAGAYMSPYIEQAMEPALREAGRASDIQRNVNQAQAVKFGAFGGARQAIVEAERQRNLATQQGDIRAKGLQTAYEQAANQFNQDMQRRQAAQQLGEQSRQYGAGLGLQGLQTAGQLAGTMGQLGGQQFQQQKDVIGLQSQLGAQQQAQAQRPLDMAYQDFLNQQKYPYQQLEFMSNLIKGTPMGTVQSLYQAPPSTMQNLGALGLGAYGASKLFAEGGQVNEPSYGLGGIALHTLSGD